jgi:mevalonate kinase
MVETAEDLTVEASAIFNEGTTGAGGGGSTFLVPQERKANPDKNTNAILKNGLSITRFFRLQASLALI